MLVKFNLSRNYKMIPEGTHELTIQDCVASPSGAPTEVKITWSDKEGTTVVEKCNFKTTLWKLSRICEVAFGIKDGEEMELDEIIKKLKGKTFVCEVVHTKGTQPREDGSYATFVNINKVVSLVEVDDSVLPNVMTQSSNPRESILEGL